MANAASARPPAARRPGSRTLAWIAAAALALAVTSPAPVAAQEPDPIHSPSAAPATPSAELTSPPPAEPDSQSTEPVEPPAGEPAQAAEPPAPQPAESVEPPASSAAPPAEVLELPATVPLKGVLLVTPVEAPAQTGAPRQADSGRTVRLVTAEGASVELTGEAVAEARSGDRFHGTVVVEQAVADAVEEQAPEPLPRKAADLAELVADASAGLDQPLQVMAASTSTIVKPSSTAKAHTVDVIYLHAEGQPTPSSADAEAAVARLSEFWNSESGGQISEISLSGELMTRTVAASLLCEAEELWSYAAGPEGFQRTSTQPAGTPDSYYWAGSHTAHLVVLVPGDSCGEGNGLGTIGSAIHSGGATWAAVDPADPLTWDGVVFHEIGHNLGLDHSGATICAKPIVDGPSCSISEYADYYDVMGGGYSSGPFTNSKNVAALNVGHKALLNALPRGSDLLTVEAKGGLDQQFTLAPAGETTGLRGLEVVDPLNGDKLYVEYRSGAGRDAASFYTVYSAARPWNPTYAPGVRVLKLRSAAQGGGTTVLRRWQDSTAALSYRAGDEFRSRTANAAGEEGVRITVTSATSDEAVVEVSFATPPVESRAPTISGTPRIGITLTASPGSWTPGASFDYQWLVGGTEVAGATDRAFVPRTADLGKVVEVRVTGALAGFESVTRTSAATAKVLPLLSLKTRKPTISGTPRIGVKLTVKPGAWTAGTAFSYQWLVAGKAVKGATASTFVPRSSDKGKRITVRVTGVKPGYRSATATSKSSSKVLKLRTLKTDTPKISGSAKAGSRLTAKPGKWTSGTKLTYQWLVGGTAVAGATSSSFVPQPADLGRTVKVTVTGTKAGYKTTSKTSKPTRAVS